MEKIAIFANESIPFILDSTIFLDVPTRSSLAKYYRYDSILVITNRFYLRFIYEVLQWLGLKLH